MTIGVGTSDRQSAMDSLSNMTGSVVPISDDEFSQRLKALQAQIRESGAAAVYLHCLLYTSPSPRDRTRSRMPSSA